MADNEATIKVSIKVALVGAAQALQSVQNLGRNMQAALGGTTPIVQTTQVALQNMAAGMQQAFVIAATSAQQAATKVSNTGTTAQGALNNISASGMNAQKSVLELTNALVSAGNVLRFVRARLDEMDDLRGFTAQIKASKDLHAATEAVRAITAQFSSDFNTLVTNGQKGATITTTFKNAVSQFSATQSNASSSTAQYSTQIQNLIATLSSMGAALKNVRATQRGGVLTGISGVAQTMQQAQTAATVMSNVFQQMGVGAKTTLTSTANGVKVLVQAMQPKYVSQFAQSFNIIPRIMPAVLGALSGIMRGVQALGTIFKNAIGGILQFGRAILSIPAAPLKAVFAAFDLRSITSVIAGLIGYNGLKGLGRELGEIAQQSGPIQSLRTTFVNFVQQARANVDGFTMSASSLVGKMSEMTNGALQTTDMLKYANMAFTLIGDQVGSKLPQMLQVAQASALATGQSIEYMFESMVKGVARQENRWLDNLGITIDLNRAYQTFAEENNKSAESLTESERIIASLNETLRIGENVLLKVGDASLFLSTRAQAVSNAFANTRDEIINDIAPIATVILTMVQGLVSEALPKIELWVQGFVDAFAKFPSAVDRARANLGNAPQSLVDQIISPIATGKEQMGYQAAQWAINAATWGVNVGTQFATGIMNGFAQVIVFVMNTISSILANWLQPHSPPKVVADIDKWGEATMGEFVKGMLAYPIGTQLPNVSKELKAVLEGGVKQELLQWGIDAMATWTKGLSIIDMEFLTQQIEMALSKAKMLGDQLEKSYKKQSLQLFKMQVLNKDPQAIRNQLAQVKTTRLALRGNELEIEQLEMKEKLLRDQMELMRLILKAFKEQEEAAERAGADRTRNGTGTGTGAEDILSDIQMPVVKPLEGTSDLAERLKGIKETFDEILGDNPDKLVTAWDNATSSISTAFENLSNTIDTLDIKTKIGNIKDAIAGIMDAIFSRRPPSRMGLLPEDEFESYGTAFEFTKSTIQDLRRLGTEIGDFGRKFIEPLLPSIERLTEDFPKMIDAIGKAAGGEGGDLALKFLTGLGQVIGGISLGALDGLVRAITDIAESLDKIDWRKMSPQRIIGGGFLLEAAGKILIGALNGLADVVTGWFNTTWKDLWETKYLGPIKGLSASVNTAIDEVTRIISKTFSEASGKLDEFLSPMADSVNKFTQDVIAFFTNLYDVLVGNSIIPDMMSEIKDIWDGTFGALIDPVADFVEDVIRTIANLYMKMTGWWLTIADSATSWWNNIREAIVGTFTGITAGLEEKYLEIKKWFDETFLPRMYNFGEMIVNSIQNGIEDTWWRLINALQLLVSGVKQKAIEALLGVGVAQNAAFITGQSAGLLPRAPAMATAPAGGTVINFYGPIVESMSVTDARTGRAMSQQIAQDIGRMVNARKSP